jgi:hypothetical protein
MAFYRVVISLSLGAEERNEGMEPQQSLSFRGHGRAWAL